MGRWRPLASNPCIKNPVIGWAHDGERYEVNLCQSYFFATTAYLKRERRTVNLLEENQRAKL
ncbi:hypothetical protein E5221_03895 [Pseudomonas sp. A2]|nr:hypothetical protein E5221_03895 [Pseudomonas sp. A2]